MDGGGAKPQRRYASKEKARVASMVVCTTVSSPLACASLSRRATFRPFLPSRNTQPTRGVGHTRFPGGGNSPYGQPNFLKSQCDGGASLFPRPLPFPPPPPPPRERHPVCCVSTRCFDTHVCCGTDMAKRCFSWPRGCAKTWDWAAGGAKIGRTGHAMN